MSFSILYSLLLPCAIKVIPSAYAGTVDKSEAFGTCFCVYRKKIIRTKLAGTCLFLKFAKIKTCLNFINVIKPVDGTIILRSMPKAAVWGKDCCLHTPFSFPRSINHVMTRAMSLFGTKDIFLNCNK